MILARRKERSHLMVCIWQRYASTIEPRRLKGNELNWSKWDFKNILLYRSIQEKRVSVLDSELFQITDFDKQEFILLHRKVEHLDQRQDSLYIRMSCIIKTIIDIISINDITLHPWNQRNVNEPQVLREIWSTGSPTKAAGKKNNHNI